MKRSGGLPPVMKAEFVLSAADPRQFPTEGLPEVAFLGRSNVGKSSLLNALIGRKLAFTSGRPGCTQLINFFRIDDRLHLVDLPGYGYAQVPHDKTLEWKRLIEAYLEKRTTLVLSVLLLDSRRGWMDKDNELREWLDSRGRPYLAVATKVDKLKTQREQRLGMEALRQGNGGVDVLPFSAVSGQGVRQIWQAIWKTQASQ